MIMKSEGRELRENSLEKWREVKQHQEEREEELWEEKECGRMRENKEGGREWDKQQMIIMTRGRK